MSLFHVCVDRAFVRRCYIRGDNYAADERSTNTPDDSLFLREKLEAGHGHPVD